jgi:hypothetical protein
VTDARQPSTQLSAADQLRELGMPDTDENRQYLTDMLAAMGTSDYRMVADFNEHLGDLVARYNVRHSPHLAALFMGGELASKCWGVGLLSLTLFFRLIRWATGHYIGSASMPTHIHSLSHRSGQRQAAHHQHPGGPGSAPHGHHPHIHGSPTLCQRAWECPELVWLQCTHIARGRRSCGCWQHCGAGSSGHLTVKAAPLVNLAAQGVPQQQLQHCATAVLQFWRDEQGAQ